MVRRPVSVEVEISWQALRFVSVVTRVLVHSHMRALVCAFTRAFTRPFICVLFRPL